MIFATSGTDVSCAGPPKHDLIGPSLSLMGLGRVRLGIRGPAANTAQPPPELRCLLFRYLPIQANNQDSLISYVCD